MAEATPSALATLIVVPGAWHSPQCYDPVVEHLQSSINGITPSSTFNIIKIPLPSVSCPRTSPSMISWEPDVNAILDVLIFEVSKLTHDCQNKYNKLNVLVVSHSYGSFVADEALGSLISSHPQIASTRTLQHLILCGFMMNTGGAMRNKPPRNRTRGYGTSEETSSTPALTPRNGSTMIYQNMSSKEP